MFNFYQQASKFALPEWNYKNIEWYAQDNWKPTDRFTLDYGVRFYYLTPQWDTTLQASNFLPDQFDFKNAAKLYTPVCVGGAPGAGCVRRGMDPTLIAANTIPTMANTVEERFIGRLTPGSNRFNGSFQAGKGIDDQLQDGNAFRVSPRIGAVYDLTGKGETIVRGGFGIFYDRPQGNMVFDMISNAPGVLNSRLDYGRLQDLTSSGGDPNPTLSLNPTAFGFKPPRVNQWNVGVQHKLVKEVILDVAYVGSRSTDLLRQVQINAVPFGATFLPQNQDPTRVPSSVPGATALPNDFLRPYRGYGNIRMWDYSGYADYKALQTSVTRRFDRGFMVSGFWVWSKAQGINSTDFAAGVPNLTEEQTQRARLRVAGLRPDAQLHDQRHLPDTDRDEQQRPGPAGERLADLGRLPLDERPAEYDQLLDPRHRRREPDRHRRQSERADRPDLRSGHRLQRRSVQAVRQPGVLRAAAAGQQWQRNPAVLRPQPAAQQSRPVGVEKLPDCALG